MMKNKEHAKQFLKEYFEFSMPSYYENSIWFRYDGEGEYKKPYTIDHEEKGIIGATEDEATAYIYRNRRRINEWLKDRDTYAVNAVRR